MLRRAPASCRARPKFPTLLESSFEQRICRLAPEECDRGNVCARRGEKVAAIPLLRCRRPMPPSNPEAETEPQGNGGRVQSQWDPQYATPASVALLIANPARLRLLGRRRGVRLCSRSRSKESSRTRVGLRGNSPPAGRTEPAITYRHLRNPAPICQPAVRRGGFFCVTGFRSVSGAGRTGSIWVRCQSSSISRFQMRVPLSS